MAATADKSAGGAADSPENYSTVLRAPKTTNRAAASAMAADGRARKFSRRLLADCVCLIDSQRATKVRNAAARMPACRTTAHRVLPPVPPAEGARGALDATRAVGLIKQQVMHIELVLGSFIKRSGRSYAS